ncbi:MULTISPECIES: hypothetical protein [unclassified Streptomyces]|uniref:hypothetical protein n=1 Tax=unclassified Streptomyces TaxID=2593676 RepID=UPI00093E1E3E|nr:hypothetical protein [Streptomyces sp. CB02058]OKI90966.1 hypothetical protein AMK10_29110 [Streptomyces sp. CB02058]
MAAETSPGAVTGLLEGAVVRSVGRAADMGVVELESPSGETVMIHAQCPFRVVHEGRTLLGSADMRFARKGAGDSAFDDFRTVYDARAETLNKVLGQLRPRVDDVAVGEAGELALSWAPAFRLALFPDCSGAMEAWRVFVRGGAHHGFPPDSV